MGIASNGNCFMVMDGQFMHKKLGLHHDIFVLITLVFVTFQLAADFLDDDLVRGVMLASAGWFFLV